MSWDSYMLSMARATAENSKCLSRKIGAVITRDNRIVSTGYNGPPVGMLPCTHLNHAVKEEALAKLGRPLRDLELTKPEGGPQCPRRALGYGSGEGLHICPATHAEVNAIISAARMGVSVDGGTMWLTCEVPCQRCLGQIINAGISEVVVTSWRNYDALSRCILAASPITIRLNTGVPPQGRTWPVPFYER